MVMANNTGDGFLYFMVGALVIGLFGLGYLYYQDGRGSTVPPNLTIVDKASDRAPDIHFNIEKN
jgi:hypothetical protein